MSGKVQAPLFIYSKQAKSFIFSNERVINCPDYFITAKLYINIIITKLHILEYMYINYIYTKRRDKSRLQVYIKILNTETP